ncbi:MAG: SDR family NAD(P)-dependent oxidoreductase [Nitrososphaeria archaeon]
MNLSGKIALVTGGSRGIGRSIVLMLTNRGCNVAVNYVAHENETMDVLAQARERGVEGVIVKADVSKYSEVRDMVEKVVGVFGGIDILVNNAGIVGTNKLVNEIEDGEWDNVINVNLKGAFNCCKAVVPYMIKRGGGKIVNISSLAGKGGISPPDYCASKGGLIGLTFGLAHQLAKYRILTNAIAPGGLIETDHAKCVPEGLKRQLVGMTPVGRSGTPEDVAHAVVFVLESDYILGEVVDVNGGRYFD